MHVRTIFVLWMACLTNLLGAQDQGSIQGEVEQIRLELANVLNKSDELLREQQDLRLRLNARSAETEIETEINALADMLADAPMTVVDSISTDIRVFGQFRVRWGASWNRDFGNVDGGVAGIPALDAQAVGGGLPLELEDDDGTFLESRFLIGFDFQFSKDVSTHFVVTSYGLFENGETPGSSAAIGAGGGGSGNNSSRAASFANNAHLLDHIELYEGWIRIDRVFGVDDLSLTNGRQEIVLGNEFQFGNNEFFSGETFDAARLNWSRETFSLDLIWAKMAVGERLNTRDHPYPSVGSRGGFDDDELYSIYFSYKGLTGHVFDLYWIYFNGDRARTVGTLGNSLGSSSIGDNLKEVGFAQAFFHTFGLRASGEFGIVDGLDYNVEVAYQTGNLKDFAQTDVAGLAIEAELGLTVAAESRSRFHVRFLFAEGGENGKSGYIPLFSERQAYDDGGKGGYRARYGLLNIVPMDNVISVQGGFVFDPAPDWSVGLGVLWATHEADSAPIRSGDDDIGLEIDVFAEYRHSDEFTLGLGLGVFLPDDGAPFKNGGFVNQGGKKDPAFLIYLDARVVF